MNFLTKEQFENQAFVHFIRTGEAYFYENYLKWKRATEIKSFEEEEEKLKKKYGEDDDDDDDDDDRNDNDNEEDADESGENEDYGEDYDFDEIDDLINSLDSATKLDPNKNYVMWEGGGCETCATLNGQIFEEASAPEAPHPNCKCTLTPVDANGSKTGKPRKPRKPNPKGNCAKIQSHYGMRKHPITGIETFHHGPDISAPNGTPIKSIDDGKVIRSGAQNPNNLAEGFGYRVTLETKYGTAVYGHMNGTPAVKEGDVVSAGDLLGEVGKSGASTGNHLHYERRGKNNNSFPPSKEDLQKLLDSLNRECK